MEQEIPILNTYSSAWNTCGIAQLCEVARWRLLANGEPDTIREWVSPQTGAERAAAVMGRYYFMSAACCIPPCPSNPPRTEVYGNSILEGRYASSLGIVNSVT